MIITSISTETCISKLKSYADLEVRSWNPFKWFRKRKLNNHSVASDLAEMLGQATLPDNDLLKIANSIDGFEDSELQHDLLCFLHSNINKGAKPFVAKRQNVEQINQTLTALVNKKYRPWWTLFLIEVSYYSKSFRTNLTWLVSQIDYLFTSRRDEKTQHLIDVYSNDEIINQYRDGLVAGQRNELKSILEISLEQTTDHSQKELIREIKRIVLKGIPFGEVLISAAGLSTILVTYLSKKENRTKPINEQAIDILYIVGKVCLKVNVAQVMKAVVPGISDFSDVAGAVVSVGVSGSSSNPLDKDKKVGKAFASVAGGAVGGAIGSAIPVIGTTVGVYTGAILSKIVAAQFYQVLEAWQTAPKGPKSIIPGYTSSMLSVLDNDAKNILKPMYCRYGETEKASKRLGDEIAKWLSIYDKLLAQSNGVISDEHFEIINEEMQRLQTQFTQLKNEHARVIESLSKRKPDNISRVMDYQKDVKACLNPLHKPINGMLDKYFSAKLPADSYAGALSSLQASPTSVPVEIADADKEASPSALPQVLPVDEMSEERLNSPAM